MHVRMVFAALALGAWHSAAARADVIISNFPGNDMGGSFLNAPLGGSLPGQVQGSKAAGFTMPLVSTFTLDSIQLRLTIFNTDSVPVIALYSNNAQNNPGTLLATMINPVFTTLQTPTNYLFSPSAPFFLTSGTTYWLVASNAAVVPNSYLWLGSTPPVTPTGLATHAGFRFSDGPPPPSGFSTNATTYSIQATPVPEPATWLITTLIGGVWLAARRSK